MAMMCGFSILSLVVYFAAGLPDLSKLSGPGMLATLWLGPLGTTATYLYWMYALKEAPVATVALTLFVQPVVGSLLGTVLLGEKLTAIQALGGAIIVLAVFAQTVKLPGLSFVRPRHPLQKSN
jgi:drug/metabolite transporter (DMT)-like permease